MAAGSVTVAALRHRPRQALLVVVLAAVVTASAVLGPLYARAVEQSVVRNVVADAPATSSTLVVTDDSDDPTPPGELLRVVRPELTPQFGAAVRGADVQVELRSPTGVAARARLTSRAGVCAHLDVVDGRCPRTAGEALVSVRATGVLGVRTGDLLPVRSGDPAAGGVSSQVTVVGTYGPLDATSRYWAGRARPPVTARPTQDATVVRTVDDVFTPWATLAAQPWPGLRTHLDVPLHAARLTLDDLPRVQAVTKEVDDQVRTLGGSAASPINALLESTNGQRDQARTVIPLLAVQLAVLGIVVLAFVCAAATEQRRPEIALARLRGHGVLGAGGMLLRELGVLVVAGGVLGTGLGWLVADGAAHWWLEPGVRPEAREAVALAAVASVAAGLLAIVAAGTPTLRQPLTVLLRRVPPRSSTLQVGLVEGAVAAAAVAGLVTLLSGAGGGISLLAPGLLAIAGGLLLAQATIPTAGPLARAALRGGRLPWALAGLQVARRPALRRLIAIITVACALLVFAVDAWTVSGRNREVRAEVAAGAPVVLDVDADSSLALRRALLDIDPRGRYATPVATVSSASAAGPRTTAVEPAAFARIARWGTRSAPAGMRSLVTPLPDPVRVQGTTVEVDARFTARAAPPGVGVPKPVLAPMRLFLAVADSRGVIHRAGLGRLVPDGRRHTYSGTVDCTTACALDQVQVMRTFGDFVDAHLSIDIDALRTGTAGALTPVDLDNKAADAWQALPWRPDFFGEAFVSEGPSLHVEGDSFGTPLVAQRGTHPVNPPALVAGEVPSLANLPGLPRLATASDLQASDIAYAVRGRLPQVPRTGGRGVLVDLEALAAGPSLAPGQTSYAVWLADDDPVREARLRRQLNDHGLQVLSRDTTGDHVSAFADEGPALALRLAVLAGVVAVVLAAAVLVVGVATSGAGRARDLAGLRLVGVPSSTVRRASVREHLVVAVLGVVAGTVLGLVAAQAALPDIPLFATPDRSTPLVLDPAWAAVAVTAAGSLVLLCAVSVAVGRALASSAVPARLREGR